MSIIDLPPNAPVLMEATRAIGYSLSAAIADIIDNSISVSARNVWIQFFPVGDAYVAILDNGTGMNREELINAMRYGSKNPMEDRDFGDLGRFGLGLKTASMSQCRKLTVISKKGSEVTGAQWDLDYVIETQQWSLKLLDQPQIDAMPYYDGLAQLNTGTLVIWQELDRMKIGQNNFEASMGRMMDEVRNHLALVFHRYLMGERGLIKLDMEINNVPLAPIDPFLSGKSTQTMDDEIISIDGNNVVVCPYILPHLSTLKESEITMLGGKDGLRKLQGFYVYRNRRLLIWGTWFRLMRQGDLSKLARVRVDIPNSLDHLWTLDIKKSAAIPPEVVRRNLAPITDKISEASKRTYTYRGRKETEDSVVHVWNRVRTRQGGIMYQINRGYPMVESLATSSSNIKRAVEQLLIQIERNLPLNQLYVDLTNDEPIYNDHEHDSSDIVAALRELLERYDENGSKIEMLRRLSIIEPFNRHPEIIENLAREYE